MEPPRSGKWNTGLPPALFHGDHLALDFVNTRLAPAGTEIEWLPDGDRFCAWLAQAEALSLDVIGRLCASSGPAARDEVAREARALREWFRGFVEARAGTPLTGASVPELRPLNDLLGRDALRQEIISEGGHAPLVLRAARDWTAPEQLLQPVAAVMADLVCNADFSRVRQCEGPGCTLLFLDRTKNHQRRFCSPALCGNRAKQAAHRARTRSGRSQGA